MRLKPFGLSICLSALGVASIGLLGSSTASADPLKTGSPAQHVIYVIADNIHLSDIQKMPHLMQFLHQGTLFNNDHTILDSHTQDGMLSDITGQYPSKTGVPDQSFYANGVHSYFQYWTSTDHDGQPHVTSTPPWTTFNRQGLSVGAIGTPDMELESASEVQQLNPVDGQKSDYLGVAVHQTDGTAVLGSPNLPYIYNAASWTDSSRTLGGFPGWGSADPNWPLQATYEMQTHGVPVTFTYLHDVHEVNGKQVGPGQYDGTIAAYDEAFAKFFAELNAAGLNKDNTLFVFTTDEGDHYIPQGEQNTNLQAWIANTSSTPSADLQIVSDSGALVYVKNKSEIPQTLAAFQSIPGWNYLADSVELSALHMNMPQTPSRTPSFVVFSKPDVWYNNYGSTDWTGSPDYMWNHGTISPDILQTWLGMVGPGVKQAHTSDQWLDHTDTMPTIYALLGYDLTGNNFDGVPAIDGINPAALPKSARASQTAIRQAEEVYKQLNAPVGQFGMSTLQISTQAALNALNENGTRLDSEIGVLTQVRDRMARQLQDNILHAWSAEAPAEAPAKSLDQSSREAQNFISHLDR